MPKRHPSANNISTSKPAKRGRRVFPERIQTRPFTLTNLANNEVVHQKCLALHGTCSVFDYAHETNYVSIVTRDATTTSQPDPQHWPAHNGAWKALVLLNPGQNTLTLSLNHNNSIHGTPFQLTVTYMPLLQLPPLHLAILVASDSPLLIDCPPAKYGALSTAHSTLDAAIAKLRMAAYMWQALTAEDLRGKGLGRRAFRLEEEWGRDTSCISATRDGKMGSVPRVHVVRSDKTVAQIRDAQVAQQNPHARDRDALHAYFEAALAAHGPPFENLRSSRPVVAGMILDSHYDAQRDLIVGHAALGCHRGDGLSLGVLGSHLAYSWPRFLEEVAACLTDCTETGSTVGNDNGECGTMQGACFVGQGAFLHEVGHAFGAGHTSGIMARGYAGGWGRAFVEHERNMNCSRAGQGNEDAIAHEAKWDLRDALQFRLLPHFALPGDRPVEDPGEFRRATVCIEAGVDSDDIDEEEEDGDEFIQISCKAGLAQVQIQNGQQDPITSYNDAASNWTGQCTLVRLNPEALAEFSRTEPLKITALAMSGKERTISNAWTLLNQKPYISIPGTDIILRKQAISSSSLEESSTENDAFIPWTVLLHHRGKDGNLHRATCIDLRVGCTMDGAVVYYADGRHENCGPALDASGQPHYFGGHASERRDLPEGESISRVLVCSDDDGWGSLAGIRMVLGDGTAWGELNSASHDYEGNEDGELESQGVFTLEPEEGEVIVGFYGLSAKDSGFCHQFGILTALRDVQLPEVLYDMPELGNAGDRKAS
ncbi:uncharacterized protein DSM5745_01285 [Aspergillus mulundensis]|uniref:Jacalin-type lectin domain-containing protein n=1 Tax=Aspergillus mulundensis TaxID=1810919 RepID=A0A3D8T5Y7_9EURO|nr:Uncharacterized protein DSM5745_01285 [Aspergillus mulundensis]RDW93963.1 Uncharacterized protein DSM5745_01285 [Aspergillus mulundensis]